jgi:prepilin-type N-terminal cleavage/methylation domain-containing protein
MSERIDRRSASGFTVTELLVVIAIIALIVSLVASAAGPLRQNAWSTKDLTQLRTLSQAINAYAADQAGGCPARGPRTSRSAAAWPRSPTRG